MKDQITMMMSGTMPIAYILSLKQPHLVLKLPFLYLSIS